jgi:hypothetical protein
VNHNFAPSFASRKWLSVPRRFTIGQTFLDLKKHFPRNTELATGRVLPMANRTGGINGANAMSDIQGKADEGSSEGVSMMKLKSGKRPTLNAQRRMNWNRG